MPKKQVNVRITTMDAELEFSIKPSTTGKMLFDQVVRTIGLREVWFFGLQFVDNKGYTTWLVLTKKVLDQVDKKHENPLQFRFRAKFYPEDVGEEIIQEITLRMFYLQVKSSILSDEIYCPAETATLLSSYAVQAKYGDYIPEYHKPGFLANDRLLPQRVMDQHKLTRDQWEDKITVWHKEHRGLLREEAMMEYLKLAQDLEMYGVNYFEIENKRGTEVYLGVDALGINVYEKNDKLTPKIGFPWVEIRNITFNKRKFIIKPVDKTAKDFIFTAPHVRVNKTILTLCMGNHDLSVKRRMADTIEVQQMKIQAREERTAKKVAREKLDREIALREEAEKRQREFEERLVLMNREMEQRQSDLHHAQETIRALEEQLRDLQRAKEELENKQDELRTMMVRLEEAKEMEAEERARLEEEIRSKRDEVERIRDEVQYKDEETRRLQEEVAEARRREEEATQALATASLVRKASTSSSSSSEEEKMKHVIKPDFFPSERVEVGLQQRAYNGDMYGGFEAAETIDRHSISRKSSTSSSASDRTATNDRASMFGGSYQMPEVTPTPEMLEIHEPKQDSASTRRMKLLEEVKLSLAAERKQGSETQMDVIHSQNIKEGKTKYKTLREVRKGNTKRRVDQFENM
ncbi:moesin/ezrin/radixin homolog 1-like [Macrobrachium rosenbergii]|uniref:moesin/ezrin/radixin homolog 1-like n=1 Tax=Macrobrachium rosenbergii TaxID=79674 RepID=UPI0034D596E5